MRALKSGRSAQACRVGALCVALVACGNAADSQAPLRPRQEAEPRFLVRKATSDAPSDAGVAGAGPTLGTEGTQLVAPGGPEPLTLCNEYFPGESPLLAFWYVPLDFWKDGLDDCRVAGFFAELSAAEHPDYLNYLFNWSLLLFGCETVAEVAGGLAVFGPANLPGAPPLTRADLENLREHYLATLGKYLPLDAEDTARVRSALVLSSAGVSLAAGDGSLLDRCGEGPDGV